MTGQTFRTEQRRVATFMVAGLAGSLVVFATAMLTLGPGARLPFSERLQSTLRIDAIVALWLVAAVANVARLRFFSEQDIAGAAGRSASGATQQASAILQNTLEQVVLAVAAHLSIAATFARSDTIIAVLGGLFVVGRLLFWTGYRHGAQGRALGFALTFYPSSLALLTCAFVSVHDWAIA